MQPGIGVGLFAPDDTIAYASPAFIENWDIGPDITNFSELVRHHHRTRNGIVIDTDDVDEWLRKANGKRRSKPIRAFEVDMHNGRWFWVTEVTFDGGWILLTTTDVSRLKIDESAMRQARDDAIRHSETDALTGLSNRLCSTRTLIEHTREANLTNTALCAALIDIDHFKSINDTYGHDTGDSVLQHFAALGRTLIRKSDVLARVGGEEFLLILPCSDLEEAFCVVDRLRDQIAASPNAALGSIRYTVSAGVAQLQAGETHEQLYRRADQALYRAKRTGRNRVVAAGADPHVNFAAAS